MRYSSIADQVLDAAATTEIGTYTVVLMAVSTRDCWSVGAYRTARVAFSLATRHQSDDTNAYVVKHHPAGLTAYLAPDTILASRLTGRVEGN
jgi:hypothetical protein